MAIVWVGWARGKNANLGKIPVPQKRAADTSRTNYPKSKILNALPPVFPGFYPLIVGTQNLKLNVLPPVFPGFYPLIVGSVTAEIHH